MLFRLMLTFLLAAGPFASQPVLAEAMQRTIKFKLTDQNGQIRTEADFAGKPVVLHFGFTHCPVVCPTTLYELAQRMQELGKEADRITFIFVSVDPARDTPELLKSYIGSFDDRIVGLTGDSTEVARVAEALGAQVEKMPLAEGGYEMAHTIFGYLFSSQWKRSGVLYMGTGTKPDAVIEKLRALIAAAPRS